RPTLTNDDRKPSLKLRRPPARLSVTSRTAGGSCLSWGSNSRGAGDRALADAPAATRSATSRRNGRRSIREVVRRSGSGRSVFRAAEVDLLALVIQSLARRGSLALTL